MTDFLAQALALQEAQGDVRPKPMDEARLRSIIETYLSNAGVFDGGETDVERNRKLADDYYTGAPRGDEEDGLSQVVSRDTAEAVDSIMPSLMRIFASGDRVVVFEPFAPDDEDKADQATDYTNHIFLQENEGFQILYAWFKDALLKKNGVVKVFHETRITRKKERYTGLTEDQVNVLLAKTSAFDVQGITPRVEMQSVIVQDPSTGAPVPMEQPVTLYDVDLAQNNPQPAICVQNVPPEEFIIDGAATSLDDARFCGHRCARTVSDLVELGYNYDELKDLPPYDAMPFWSHKNGFADDADLDDSSRRVSVTEAYIKVDFDGDGIAEWRQVVLAGDNGDRGGGIILSNVEVDDHPFAGLTPDPVPHQYHGQSLFDKTKDIQDVKTALWRGALDSIYLANQPRTIVDMARVEDINDVLDVRKGGVIRSKNGLDVAAPFPTVGAAPQAFTMIEYVDTVREQRTGVTRYNQGLDANSLNKTATGINIIANAGKERIELIARVFAETGVKRLFRLLFALTCKHQDKEKVVRLRDKWVTVNPRDWADKMDAVVSVGVGLGNKDQQLALASQMMQVHERIVAMQGGLKGPLVDGKNVYNVLKRFVEAIGWKSADPYFTDPSTVQEPPPSPPPELVKVQAETEAKAHLIQLQAQADALLKDKDAQVELAKHAAEQETARYRVDMDNSTRLAIAQIQDNRIAHGSVARAEAMGANDTSVRMLNE